MPRIKMALVVEFDADQSDPNTIHLALDQLLHFQPACSIVSKRVIEIDGTAAVGEDDLSSAETIARYSRSSAVDSYRPDYSERSRDQLLDSYRPGTVDGHATSSQGIDSYRPNGRVSDLAASHPDRQQPMTRSDETNDFQNEGGELSSSTVLGTRYDALVDDMVLTPNSQLMTNNNSSNNNDTHTRTRRSGSHYSPPPRRDRRSASPQNERRRSERLRTVPSRNMSQRETSHKTKLERWKNRRDEEMKRIEAARGSLEYLAPLFSDKGKFERQRERHGITEALRLKNLRTNHKLERARRQLDKQRWGDAGETAGGGGEVKQGARMDAVIDQIASFDFSAPSSGTTNGDGSGHPATHPPVETRKQKGAGARKRGRGRAAIREKELEKELADSKPDNDDEMHDAHPHPSQTQTQTQAPQPREQQMKSQASSTGMADMAIDGRAEGVNVLGGSSSSSSSGGGATNTIPPAADEEGVA